MRNTDSSDNLSKWLFWSFLGHASILAFIILKNIILPSTPIIHTPILRVDVVGLPEILKKDLSQIQKQQEKKVTSSTLTPPPPPAKDEMVLQDQKKSEAQKKSAINKNDEKIREKKMSSALARIRALERLKEDETTSSEIVIKGNQISKGSSLSGEAKESAETSYYDLVKDHLLENWVLPPWLARQKLSAQIVIKISSLGEVTSLQFTRPSGNEQFDKAIRDTIRLSTPFPKPSSDVLNTVQERGVLIGFPL